MENKQRLAKRIAESGIASRREAERLIAAGKVFVDGICITSPICFVDANNIITVNNQELQKKSNEIVIWKFYKPTGVITSRNDPQGRKTVFDFFDKMDQRLLYIGRLDYNSEGLLLFTNNGDIARKMELPKTAIRRTYKARIFGKFTEKNAEILRNGITINGIKYKAADIEIETSDKKNNWLRITLMEGKNREIRKMMEYFGYTVNRLIRISYGPFKLGNMNPGEIMKADRKEMKKFTEILCI